MAATTTTFQVGTYNSLTDAFTLVLDLNDFVTYWIEKGSMKLDQPKKEFVRSFNVRTPGEPIQRYQYRNRHIMVSLRLKGASTTAILASIRSLLSAIEKPPYVLRIQLPGGSLYSYADVVAVEHNIPTDPQVLLALAIKNVQISFECKPGLRGDRVYLSNLVMNPGFEAPSGAPIVAFSDTFATVNAYAVQAGSAPTTASNVMTLVTGARVSFGNPAWGPMNLWSIRFKWVTSLVATFYLHFTDANNYLAVVINGATIVLQQTVAGTTHTIQSTTATLTTATNYWMQVSQFPALNFNTPYVSSAVLNDSAGAPGSTIATAAGATFDALTALIGRPQIAASGASLALGGAFANVHVVSLFGPGGWLPVDFQAPNTVASYGWDTVNTYPNGPVTSVASARVDLSPASASCDGDWLTFNAGAPAGTSAIPLSASGDVVYGSVWVKTSGMAATSNVLAILTEYNAAGTFLTQSTLQTAAGNTLGSWTQFSGHVTTGSGGAASFVGLKLKAQDLTGGSPNGITWFDNCQVWDSTANGGQTTMPYCELRFPQSPASLMVSGVVGDMMSPAFTEIGTYFAAWNMNHTASLYMGRRAVSTASLPMASWAAVNFGNPFSYVFALDSASYGGFYLNTTLGSADSLQPQVVSVAGVQPSGVNAMGQFHVLGRDWTADLTPASVLTITDAGQSITSSTYPTNNIRGPNIFAFSAGSTWTLCDDGPIALPPFPQSTLADNTQVYIRAASQYTGTAATRQAFRSGWHALMPIDGELFIANMINPSNAYQGNLTTSYLYTYVDGVNQTTTYSVEAQPLPVPAHAGGSYGSLTTNSVSVNADADPWLRLDPTLSVGSATGVNEFCVMVTDDAATVLNVAVDFIYSPLYLFPR